MTKTHQVRNGATLAFAALLPKVVGYMNAANPAAGGASRRAVAGDEFFRRFPATHPFLLAELTEAAERLESQTDGAVHPALYPILALLSRLRPPRAPARESAEAERHEGEQRRTARRRRRRPTRDRGSREPAPAPTSTSTPPRSRPRCGAARAGACTRCARRRRARWRR